MRISNTVFNSTTVLIMALMLVGCFEKKTEDPSEAYQYWAGDKPSKEVQVMNAKYWESAHWSKEYIMYLELIASPEWRAEFIKQNNLKPSWVFTVPDDAPSWFKPKPDYKIWRPSGWDQGSVYFEDTVQGRVLIYEIQL